MSQTQYTLKIEGMACSMCEAHINDAIRRAFPVQKVSSSHKRGEAVVVSEAELDQDRLRDVITQTGYRLLEVQKAPYQKKGLFHLPF